MLLSNLHDIKFNIQDQRGKIVIRFAKYHGLGNDYLVLNSADIGELDLFSVAIKACDRNYGIGSDGILVGDISKSPANFSLRIINPDGSEAEKSGNGLRIFSRYLWDIQQVTDAPFTIDTKGGLVTSQILEGGKQVRVEMGKVSFNSTDIGMIGEPREVILEKIHALNQEFTFCGASVGNPHCVITDGEVTAEAAKKYGPYIEQDQRFLNRTNVQFMCVVDRETIKIEIWERGAGYTLASGSSSTSAAAVAYRLGLCDQKVKVNMPGGQLLLEFDDSFNAIMTGPVIKIGEGSIHKECLS